MMREKAIMNFENDTIHTQKREENCSTLGHYFVSITFAKESQAKSNTFYQKPLSVKVHKRK